MVFRSNFGTPAKQLGLTKALLSTLLTQQHVHWYPLIPKLSSCVQLGTTISYLGELNAYISSL